MRTIEGKIIDGLFCDKCGFDKKCCECREDEVRVDAPGYDDQPTVLLTGAVARLYEFEKRLAAAQKELPPEYAKVLDDHLADLLER